MQFKSKMVGIVGAAAMLAFPAVSLAAVNLTFLTVDGATNATVSEGSSVNGKVTFDITSSTDVESMSWELVGSGLPQTCVDVVDRIADGTFTNSFDLDTTGASEGTWDLRIRSYGDDGADVSNLCEATDQSDSQNFNDRLTVIDSIDDNQNDDGDNNPGNTGNSGNSGGSDSQLSVLIALLTKLLGGGTGSTTTPATDPACAAFAAANVGTMPNIYSPSNSALQGFLISQHMSIPALTAGAAWGYYGNQTTAALGVWRSVHPTCV